MIRVPKIIKKNVGVYNNKQNTYTVHFENHLKYDYLAGLCGYENRENEKKTTEYLVISIDDATICSPQYSGEEAYALHITEKGIAISAWTEKGISQGFKMLAVLVEKHGQNLPCMEIQDEPVIGFRGIHCCLFRPDDGTKKEDTSPQQVTKLAEQAALSGYNHIILEFWGTFPNKKHPYACWPDTQYTRPIIEKLIAHIIDDLHMIAIPDQNLTSHAGWSRIGSRQHVVLDQRPDLEDMYIPGGWCLATENPKTKQFVRDIIDDLLETFRNPPLFHVGCDKCFGFGSTEEDRTKPADALFLTHLCNLNSYLQSRGTRMVMWSDMLYSSMDALYWKPAEGIADQLPKNILINVWTHNDVGDHWADIDYFQSRGFETVYSPFLDKKGIDSMIKLCVKKNSLGILQTTWHKPVTALEQVKYSGLVQWNGGAVSKEKEKEYEGIF